MTFWIKTAGLFLIRSWRSTAILALMVFSAVSVLIFLSALAEGINDAMIRNSVRLFSGHISGFDLPASVTLDNLRVNGVESVLKRNITHGILEHNGRFETIALISVDPDQEKKETALWKKTVSGRYLAGPQNEIYISRPIAEHLDIADGDNVDFRTGLEDEPVSLNVSGIYKTGIDRLDRGIAFCSQDKTSIPSGTWQAAIFLKDGYKSETVLESLPEKNSFKTWSGLMPDLKQLIDLNYVSMSIVTILVFGVVSIGIACAFAIFILRNLREYGIMKAMGVTSAETLMLIFSEVVLMNVAASVAGILGGILSVSIAAGSRIDLGAFTSHNQYFAVSGIIYPRLTAYALLLPPLLAFLFSLIAAIWPAVIVIRKQTAAIIRSI